MIGSSEIIVFGMVLALFGAVALTVVDIFKRKDLGDGMKVFWVLVVIFLNLLGIFIYILVKTWQYYEMGRRGE